MNIVYGTVLDRIRDVRRVGTNTNSFALLPIPLLILIHLPPPSWNLSWRPLSIPPSLLPFLHHHHRVFPLSPFPPPPPGSLGLSAFSSFFLSSLPLPATSAHTVTQRAYTLCSQSVSQSIHTA